MKNYKFFSDEMMMKIEKKPAAIAYDLAGEIQELVALALMPDTLCPVCDCMELSERTGCPSCGYRRVFDSVEVIATAIPIKL